MSLASNMKTDTNRAEVDDENRSLEAAYLELIKKVITRALFAKDYERHTFAPKRPVFKLLHGALKAIFTPLNLEVVRRVKSTSEDYIESTHSAGTRGEDAETMIGMKQLDQMQVCIQDVINRGVKGDLVEAGVWRGGMTIFMQAVLKVEDSLDRKVWVLDSFSGLPSPDEANDSFGWQQGDMAASLEEVKNNFKKYDLLDENVKFVKGYFNETLAHTPIQDIAVLRIDADLYESTLDVLNALYPKLSVGGYAVFDDYTNLEDCRRAVDEYRSLHNLTEEIVEIDKRAVYWIKKGK